MLDYECPGEHRTSPESISSQAAARSFRAPETSLPLLFVPSLICTGQIWRGREVSVRERCQRNEQAFSMQ